ncbi:phosphodiester glycosidase family protein [Eubacteriales bacterium OttesenSCG-928-N14]|nr:phosphodiester glycosidase family protein [Eubacteriales bacterium OttesenSCG-928-N14]
MRRTALLLCILLCLLSGCHAAVVAPTPSAAPTTAPTEDALFPEKERTIMTEDGLHWYYANAGINIHIERVYDKPKEQSYYVATVRLRDSGQMRYTLPDSTLAPSYENRDYTFDIGRKQRAVLVISGAYFIDADNRNGVVMMGEDIYQNDDGADVLALLPDGSLQGFLAGETDAETLQQMGVQTATSFGPLLMRDGQVLQNHIMHSKVFGANPRMGIGMVDANHYIIICAEGRIPGAKGFNLLEFAQLFEAYGCTLAYNLDGGITASISFMGSQLNRNGDRKNEFRKSADVFLFGFSQTVPTMDTQRFPYAHNPEDGEPAPPQIILNEP